MLRFTIPELPRSMNAIYKIVPYWSQRRISVELKDDVRQWKSRAKEYIPPWLDQNEIRDGMAPDSTWKQMWISLDFHGNWFTKEGKVRTIDLPNLVKITVDVIAEKLKFNDSLIFEQRRLRKIQSEKQKVEVEMGYL